MTNDPPKFYTSRKALTDAKADLARLKVEHEILRRSYNALRDYLKGQTLNVETLLRIYPEHEGSEERK